jgi:uncharacterized membrane protein
MNTRTPLFFSIALVAAMLAISGWALLHLPAGTSIPIHWDADGQPDRFARGPLALFMLPAMTALIAMLFWVVPWMEPRRLNLASSAKFYRAVWIGVILLLAATHGTTLYGTLHPGTSLGSVVIATVCLLIIVVGNYLGKTRSMFLVGVRTPWTLTSEYSWQRTHSLAGKLFIASGALGFAAAIALPTKEASHVFLYALGVTVVLSIIASYVYWRRDPLRHSSDGAPE